MDHRGGWNGLKMACSGNKAFLYMVGSFDDERDILRGKVVYHNGKTEEVEDRNDRKDRHQWNRLSAHSIEVSKPDF